MSRLRIIGVLYTCLLSFIYADIASAAVIDQTGATFRNAGYTGGVAVQSFTPTQDNIVGVDIDYYNFTGTSDISISLWDIGSWTGSGFTGSALYTQILTGVTACASGDLACHEFRWESTPISLVPEQVYYLQFLHTGGAIGGSRTGTATPEGEYSRGALLFGGGNLAQADAAFRTYSASAAVPIPAAVWLFGSGLIGLVGIARRKKA